MRNIRPSFADKPHHDFCFGTESLTTGVKKKKIAETPEVTVGIEEEIDRKKVDAWKKQSSNTTQSPKFMQIYGTRMQDLANRDVGHARKYPTIFK